jgi:hypothetical protein
MTSYAFIWLQFIFKGFLYEVKKITTRTADIFIDENNILQIIIHKDVTIDYEDAIDNALVIKSLTNNAPSLKLIDMRLNCSIDKKAEKFVKSNEVKYKTIARAIIKGSVLNRLVISFFVKINKPETPTRIFTDYNEAYKWLLSMKNP